MRVGSGQTEQLVVFCVCVSEEGKNVEKQKLKRANVRDRKIT